MVFGLYEGTVTSAAIIRNRKGAALEPPQPTTDSHRAGIGVLFI